MSFISAINFSNNLFNLFIHLLFTHILIYALLQFTKDEVYRYHIRSMSTFYIFYSAYMNKTCLFNLVMSDSHSSHTTVTDSHDIQSQQIFVNFPWSSISETPILS